MGGYCGYEANLVAIVTEGNGIWCIFFGGGLTICRVIPKVYCKSYLGR